MTGLILKRAKAGMTIPAAPRMVSASLSAGVIWISLAMPPSSMPATAVTVILSRMRR